MTSRSYSTSKITCTYTGVGQGTTFMSCILRRRGETTSLAKSMPTAIPTNLGREFGVDAEVVIEAVRRVRDGAMETPEQERYIRGLKLRPTM